MKEKTIVEDWEGPVCVDDRYFSDVDEAVEYYWDEAANDFGVFDLESVPEFLECCDQKLPTIGTHAAHWLVEHIDENHPVDENGFQDYVSVEQMQKLHALIDGWIKDVNWSYYTGNNKFIQLRPLVDEYEKANQKTQMMHQAMDYAGT